jgi:hypothetical protein
MQEDLRQRWGCSNEQEEMVAGKKANLMDIDSDNA